MAEKKVIPFGNKYFGIVSTLKSPIGDKIQMEHTPHMDMDGHRTLIKDNPKPIYEMIQAHKEQCEIDRIVKRALNGDTSVLNAMDGQYIDITGAPQSLAHAQQIIIEAKRQFNELDTDTKAKFENNPEVFVAMAGSKEWCDIMGITEKIEAKKASEAKIAEYENNLHAAMANLAKGSDQKGGEVNE